MIPDHEMSFNTTEAGPPVVSRSIPMDQAPRDVQSSCFATPENNRTVYARLTIDISFSEQIIYAPYAARRRIKPAALGASRRRAVSHVHSRRQLPGDLR